MENYALLQFNNNLILQLNSAPLYFGHIVHYCLNVNFPGPWAARGKPIVLPSHNPDPTSLDFFVWGGHVKDHVSNLRVNMLAELKTKITVATANVTKDMS
jgi:hypothetical protein